MATWPESMIEVLEQLWNEGWSASQMASSIASRFPDYKGPINRNVVIGVVHRQRAKGRDFPERDERQVARHVVRRKGGARKGARVNKQRMEARRGSLLPTSSRFGFLTPAQPQSDPGIGDMAQAFAVQENAPPPKTLLELEPNECRWPVGGEGHNMLFCGCATKPKKSYCRLHGGW